MSTENVPNLSNVQIGRLRQNFQGELITSDATDYEDARKVFYQSLSRKPRLIARPADTTEVGRVVELAKDTGAPLAVRAGGHSTAGHSSSDGIVLDLRNLRGLEIDPDERTAWAEAGLRAADYTDAVGVHGLATGFGDTGSVGIGGLTVGGGIGFLVRKYGLTIDDLLAAEVVTADGRVRHASPEQDPDLFWAIRGGGGNFGVVTRFKFRLRPVTTVVGGMLILPASADVIASLVAEAENAPEDLSVIINTMLAPPMPFLPAEQHGKPIVVAMMCFDGDPETGERLVGRLRDLATPIMDNMRTMAYPELYRGFGPPDGGIEAEASRSMFLTRFDKSTAELILDRLSASTAPMATAQVRVLGGAMARVPVDATAFAHRNESLMFAGGAVFNEPAERAEHEEWIADFAGALGPVTSNGAAGGDAATPPAYVNFLEDAGQDRVRAAYPGATWDRLRSIKAQYDPDNLFRGNHNIPPAA